LVVRTSCEHLFVSENPYRKLGRPPRPNESAQLRECAVHGLVVHHRYKEGKRTRYRCKRCVGEAVTRRHRKLKTILVERFGGGCSVCGYSRCHGNLHFHHVDPTTKSFEIQMGLGKSLATFLQEAEKCVLVCANCHGEIEAGLIPSPPAGSKLHA
jgi:hypothetical protein